MTPKGDSPTCHDLSVPFRKHYPYDEQALGRARDNESPASLMPNKSPEKYFHSRPETHTRLPHSREDKKHSAFILNCFSNQVKLKRKEWKTYRDKKKGWKEGIEGMLEPSLPSATREGKICLWMNDSTRISLRGWAGIRMMAIKQFQDLRSRQ